ncbi:DUF397 domain-containing protein [Peterkaempfera griseoplana]|uniref:DUF397 domain-containing protein n=1 Tax=Peterkaempfera griseoplana TaxID=66896 RepID=UPI0006E1DFB8|nr:DUF397 domain-containing protein [Peterkaempfera griseoplana]
MSTREAFRFCRSSYSGSQGECVEVARNLHGIVGVRDSKDPQGTTLVLPVAAWSAFLAGVKAGDFPAL